MTGHQTNFHVDGSISIKDKDNVIIISYTNDNIPNLTLNLNPQTRRTFANICNSKSNHNLWYKSLGHISINKFNDLKNKNMFFDSKLKLSSQIMNVVKLVYVANRRDCLQIILKRRLT